MLDTHELYYERILMTSKDIFESLWSGAWTRNILSNGTDENESVGFLTNEGGWLYSHRIGTVAEVLAMTYDDFIRKFSHKKEISSDHLPYEGSYCLVRLGSDAAGYQDVVDNDMWCFVTIYA